MLPSKPLVPTSQRSVSAWSGWAVAGALLVAFAVERVQPFGAHLPGLFQHRRLQPAPDAAARPGASHVGRFSQPPYARMLATAYPGGRIVFGVRFGNRLRRRWITLGELGTEVTLSAARSRAKEIVSEAVLGGDPVGDRRRANAIPSTR